MLAEAKKYRAFARISLELVEEAETRHIRDRLIELSRIWSKAAFENEKASVPESSDDSYFIRRRQRRRRQQ
jgi:hypothetical protein